MRRLALLVLFVPLTASASTRRHDVDDAEHRRLAESFPNVGFVLGRCSATLVAPTKVLTAAHCVDSAGDGTFDRPIEDAGFLLGPSEFEPTHQRAVESVVVVPGWDATLRSLDVAVVTLTRSIDDVTLALITGLDPEGMEATGVGFGLTGVGTDVDFAAAVPDGVKRAFTNVIDLLDGDDFRGTGAWLADFDSPSGDDNSLETVYGAESDAEPLPLEGNPGPGDSGGPLFVDFGDGPAVVGVASGGWHPESTGPDDNHAGRYGTLAESAVLMVEDNIDFLRDQGVPVDGLGGEGSELPSGCALPTPGAAAMVVLLPLGRRRRLA
jgi:hypothetical protein